MRLGGSRPGAEEKRMQDIMMANASLTHRLVIRLRAFQPLRGLADTGIQHALSFKIGVIQARARAHDANPLTRQRFAPALTREARRTVFRCCGV